MTTAVQPAVAWRWLALAAALLGFSAVLLGAAGSHAINLSTAAAAQRWNTALQIHYFQAAALLALAALSVAQSVLRSVPISSTQHTTTTGSELLLVPGWIQLLGTLLFCGSLYLRALQINVLPGWITPLGGLTLLSGWLLLIVLLIGLLTRKRR